MTKQQTDQAPGRLREWREAGIAAFGFEACSAAFAPPAEIRDDPIREAVAIINQTVIDKGGEYVLEALERYAPEDDE